MKYLKYIALGIFFGIVSTKSELISWFRIYEMFRFESFHMYGTIGSAVLLSYISNQCIRRFNIKDIQGEPIFFSQKEKSVTRYILGGMIFGVGWALTGACPGSLYVLVGNGAYMVLVVILFALMGTWLYGLLRDKLPH